MHLCIWARNIWAHLSLSRICSRSICKMRVFSWCRGTWYHRIWGRVRRGPICRLGSMWNILRTGLFCLALRKTEFRILRILGWLQLREADVGLISISGAGLILFGSKIVGEWVKFRMEWCYWRKFFIVKYRLILMISMKAFKIVMIVFRIEIGLNWWDWLSMISIFYLSAHFLFDYYWNWYL